MRKRLSFALPALILFAPALLFAAQTEVTLSSGGITPSTVNINAGDTVVWNNTSNADQSVTANDYSFQSGSIAPGGQFAATFNQTGDYNYYDNAQGSAYVAQVIVGGTSVTTPTSTYLPTNYVNPNATYTTPSAPTYTAQPSSNVSSLTSEVQSLIAEINALEGGASSAGVQGVPAYTVSGSCPQIGRVLSLGTSGSDVTSLQQFLGISPATGYFGTQTQAAVESWQAANSIISYGTPATTGYGVVGPRTAAAIRLACASGGVSSNSTTNSTTNVYTNGTTNGTTVNTNTSPNIVSGYLQVTPVSGAAPLAVNVIATVNTASSCTGSSYTLDYGDGTNQIISIAAGNCSQQNEQFQHTYTAAGSYTITLSAGSHYTTATVTVTGAASTSGAASSTTASGSMNAFVTSGAAPLAATFYISCASGLAYDVVFGDGTDLGTSGVAQSSCTGGLQAVSHTYTTPGTFTAQLIIFIRTAQGTISSQTVASQNMQVSGTVPSSTTPTSSGPSSYPAPTITTGIGGNPLEVQLQFTALSCGQPYTVNWGDSSGAQSSTNVDCASGTASGQTGSYSPTHTYSQASTYTITLQRTLGSGGPQTDSVQVAIVN